LEADLSHTQRAYRREAERFMLWTILERGKAMSSMTQEDCVAYRDFLANPTPRQRWCGARGAPRWSPGWRPFESTLSTGSQLQALGILTSMYAMLVAQGYLVANPWVGMALPRATRRSSATGRALSEGQWQFLMKRLAVEPECSTTTRLRLAMRLLYATGLRSAELVAATTDDLELVEMGGLTAGGAPLVAWVLHVVGKGQRPREVLVPDDLVLELGAYLQARGLAGDPLAASNAGTHILGLASDLASRAPALAGLNQADSKAGITSGTLYEQIKRFFERSAAELLTSRPQDAAKLAQASTHWLRHTHASHAIARGMPIEIERENLGHASLATTSIYVTTERQRRLQAMQAFWDRSTMANVQSAA
jgi:site-specific recombinase XerD